MDRRSGLVLSVTLAATVLAGARPLPGEESRDPDPLLPFSTLLGGSGSDAARCMRRGPDGALWIAASSRSLDFPGAPREAGEENGGDLVVLRFDTEARALLSAAWIGSGDYDSPTALVFAPDGTPWVAGTTGDVSTFPVTAGIPRPSGWSDGAFLARLLPDGSGYAWSAVIGGTGSDVTSGLTVTADGDPVLCGTTHSSDFPLANALFSLRAGNRDGFLARVRADGTGFVFSTLLGGAALDSASEVALSPSGRLLVSGSTNSADFPATARLLGPPTGKFENFLAEFEADGSALRRATLLGASGVSAMLPLPPDGLLLLGSTSSTEFPAPPAAHGPSTESDAYLLRLEDADWSVRDGALFGGSNREYYLSADVGADGTIWMTGSTDSEDLPLAGAIRPLLGSSEDAFVAAFSGEDLSLRFSTYLGGDARELGYAVVAEGDGSAWVAGATGSTDFPLSGSLQPRSSPWPEYDIYLAHVVAGEPGAIPAAPGGLEAEVLGGNAVRLRWEDRSADETGFAVLRRGEHGYARIAVLPAGATEWIDDGVLPDRGYAYALQAIGAAGGSAASAAVEVVTEVTLDVEIESGSFRFVPNHFDGSSILRLRGRLPVRPNSGDGGLDPRAEGISWETDLGYGFPLRLLAVPADDPGWKGRGRWLRWRGRDARFDYRPEDGAFRFRHHGYGWTAHPGEASPMRITRGDDAGGGVAKWERVSRFRGRIR